MVINLPRVLLFLSPPPAPPSRPTPQSDLNDVFVIALAFRVSIPDWIRAFLGPLFLGEVRITDYSRRLAERGFRRFFESLLLPCVEDELALDLPRVTPGGI